LKIHLQLFEQFSSPPLCQASRHTDRPMLTAYSTSLIQKIVNCVSDY